jgi:WD40 repeat protein
LKGRFAIQTFKDKLVLIVLCLFLAACGPASVDSAAAPVRVGTPSPLPESKTSSVVPTTTLAGSPTGTLLPGFKIEHRYSYASQGVGDVSWSPDGRLLAVQGGITEPMMTVLDAMSGKELWQQGSLGTSLFFSRDGTQLFSSGAGVRWWDSASGRQLGSITGPANGNMMDFASILADADTIVFGYTFRSSRTDSEFGSGVMRWSLAKRESFEISGPGQMPGLTFPGLLKKMAVDRRGLYLALILHAASPQEADIVELLDARSWSVVCELPAHTAAFDQQGHLLAVADRNGDITVVATDTCSPEVRIHGVQADPTLDRSPLSVVFVPSTNAIATVGSNPRRLQFWDISSGRNIPAIFSVPESLPFDPLSSTPLTFSPTGGLLATVLSQADGQQDVLDVWELKGE